MRVRKLTAAGDMSFGHNQADFWVNVPDGVGQCVRTRLALWRGQWFLDTSAGMPWSTKVLGKYTGATRDPAIQAEILGTQGVLNIAGYSSSLNRDTRKFTVSGTVNTAYGQAQITAQYAGVFA
jgi:hypothetical protein